MLCEKEQKCGCCHHSDCEKRKRERVRVGTYINFFFDFFSLKLPPPSFFVLLLPDPMSVQNAPTQLASEIDSF